MYCKFPPSEPGGTEAQGAGCQADMEAQAEAPACAGRGVIPAGREAEETQPPPAVLLLPLGIAG